MNIYDELNKISWKKKEYFLWKHDLYVLRTEELTEEQLCVRLGTKSLSYMRKWEKTQEYLMLVNLHIEAQSAKDLEEIYKIVREKALTGDEKSIKLLLDLQKNAKATTRAMKTADKTEVDSDAFGELELS